jgi:carbohydrate kinase (thermoresistant glucokinase family)
VIVVVMGVAGAGKTTVGRALAERLDWEFVDADDVHPPSSIAKMASGEALSEAERQPWLAQLNQMLTAAVCEGRSLVLACSALRKEHRAALLGEHRDEIVLVYLQADRDLVRRRLHSRQHFFPPSLAESQLDTIEPPDGGESALVADAGADLDALVQQIVEEIERRSSG